MCERSLLVQVKVHERNVSVNNVEVKARHLWGCDVYTDDSDVVAALMHCGFHEAAKAHNPPGAPGSRVPSRSEARAASGRRPPSCMRMGLWAGQRTYRRLHFGPQGPQHPCVKSGREIYFPEFDKAEAVHAARTTDP